jgi:hypothetical protein
MQAYCPSRYNVLIPLKNGRALAYNALSGGFALWEVAEKAHRAGSREGRLSRARARG